MLLLTLSEVGTYLALARAGCPRTGTCAWLPHRCSLLDPGRTAAPWLFGCPAASEWASQDSTFREKKMSLKYEQDINETFPECLT